MSAWSALLYSHNQFLDNALYARMVSTNVLFPSYMINKGDALSSAKLCCELYSTACYVASRTDMILSTAAK